MQSLIERKAMAWAKAHLRVCEVLLRDNPDRYTAAAIREREEHSIQETLAAVDLLAACVKSMARKKKEPKCPA